MEQERTSSWQQLLDAVETLPPEDQEAVVEVIRRRLADRRRAEIARNAAATVQAVREGRAPYGSVEDLKHDLLAEP